MTIHKNKFYFCYIFACILSLSALAIYGQKVRLRGAVVTVKDFPVDTSKVDSKPKNFINNLEKHCIRFTFPEPKLYNEGAFPLEKSTFNVHESKTIVSKDQNCFIIVWVSELFSVQDSTEAIKRIYKGEYILSPSDTLAFLEWNNTNRRHLRTFREILKQKEHITYYPSERAKLAYNADTVILIHPPADRDMDLGRGVINFGKFREDYPYEQTLVIQKNGRGFIYMDCYFTAEGIKRSEEYIESLGNIFWFENN